MYNTLITVFFLLVIAVFATVLIYGLSNEGNANRNCREVCLERGCHGSCVVNKNFFVTDYKCLCWEADKIVVK